jgi:hypothetical protein
MSGNAYYIPGDTGVGIKLPIGEYEAIITSLGVVDNVKCGKFIADIFKPGYKIQHRDYPSTDVKDNGIFRYKEKIGYSFKPSRNWGFAKFCGILGLEQKDGDKIALPYLKFDMIDGLRVVVEINYKNFVNESGNPVRYPVGTLKKKIGDVPF